MAFSIGIVGLPNVGKSTLFQALTKKKVEIANYPFSTIDPNAGIVKVPDERLEKIAEIFHSTKTIPTIIEFVDIAGLVKNAHKGEGLGNQFLSYIRECDSVLHIVRAFQDTDIIHVEKTVDPIRDMEIVRNELLFKDKETIQKRLFHIESDMRGGEKKAMEQDELLQKLFGDLSSGISAHSFFERNSDAKEILQDLQMLSAKPVLYVINITSDTIPSSLIAKLKTLKAPFLALNLKEELDIESLSSQETEELGVKSKLPELIQKCCELLDLITFFTGNENETRAWAVKKGTTVLKAAGLVHSDFEKKFIKAVTLSFDKLMESGSVAQAMGKGWIRTEGKDYIVHDGDVIEIRHA